MNEVKASIIILDYLKSRRVCENVRSLMAQKTTFPFEVIVVDNSANPANAEKLRPLAEFPNVRIIVNERNVGYTRGNNQGVAESRGEYILIVNPDIVWGDPTNLQKMIDHMDSHPEIGVLGPKEVNDGDGSVAMTVRRFPNFFLQVARRTNLRQLPLVSDWVAKDECRDLDYSKIQTVDWLQSSFWVTRRSLWEKFGGLDTNYRIFMSDPDYCWKCWEAGFQIVYYPEAVVHADGVRASAGGFKAFFTKWIMRQHVKDSLKYQIRYILKSNPRIQSQKIKL